MKNDIKKYLDYLKYERNFSNNTIVGYSNHLELFEAFFKEKNITNLNNIDYTQIRNYLNYLYEKNYNTKSICNHLSSLRSFFKYLHMKI